MRARYPKRNSAWTTLYLVQFVGWGDDFNTLEPRRSLDDSTFQSYQDEKEEIARDTGNRNTAGLSTLGGVQMPSIKRGFSEFQWLEQHIDSLEERLGVGNVRLLGIGMYVVNHYA